MSKIWDAIASYMDDDKREQVHAELAPCTKKEFLARYLELDQEFSDLLAQEFSIYGVDDLVEYTVIHVGGKNDGKVIDTLRDEQDAIEIARQYNEIHDGETGYLGVAIFDIEDNEVVDWE